MIGVDASVAAKWVLHEAHAETAAALYDDAARVREAVVAPSLLPIEVTNILWQRVRRHLLTREEADDALTRFLAFRVRLVSPDTIHRDALTLAAVYALPAVYDAHYLALAQQLDITLWTDDQRLLNTLGGQLAFVRSLHSYQETDA
ncbi:MAG: type II toxin-antitoxin system VapC family toxin [Chloroflexota bacterium]